MRIVISLGWFPQSKRGSERPLRGFQDSEERKNNQLRSAKIRFWVTSLEFSFRVKWLIPLSSKMFRRRLFSQARDTFSRCYLTLKRKKLTIKNSRKPFNKGLGITKQAFYWSFCRNRCYCIEFFVTRISYRRLMVNVNQRFLSSFHSQKKFPFSPQFK